MLTCLGAVALSEKKDNLKAVAYYSHALKLGSEEPTTYLNLASALENLERHQQAEAVLERGIAAYPHSEQLVARLAQQYFHDGQTWRASAAVHQYCKLFPEDPTVREVLKEIESTGNAGELSDPRSWNAPVGPPK